MNEQQEQSKSKRKLPTTPSRGASSSRSGDEYSPNLIQGNSLGNIPVNAPAPKEPKPIENELDKKAQQRETFLEKYPYAAEMLKNIDIDESDKENLEALKREFMESGFVYTMNATSADKFLNGTKKEGDCSTLANAYVKIAQEYLGIESVKVTSKSGDFFVPNGGSVLDMNNATGNVDNGRHWVFTNHYWVESPIGTIDLLFLGQKVNPGEWINKTGEGKENEIEYRIFKNYKVYDANYMAQTLADKYATDLNEAQKGKVSAEALKPGRRVEPKRSPNLLNCCNLM